MIRNKFGMKRLQLFFGKSPKRMNAGAMHCEPSKKNGRPSVFKLLRAGVRHPSSGAGLQSAFTLIELIVIMVVMGIIALITLDYLGNAGRTYALLLAQRQADNDARGIVKRIRRAARLAQVNITNTSAEWAFSTSVGATHAFRWSGDAVFLNDNILAKNVQAFQLDYYDDTNGHLTPLQLSSSNQSRVARVALELRVTNDLAAAKLKINFFLREGFLK